MDVIVKTARRIMGRLSMGDDVLAALTKCCELHNVRLGEVRALGAVSKARFGFYDQSVRKYHFIELDKHLEITSVIGNISLKDGKPFIHAHVTFTDDKGTALGGHLAEGTIVFACEYVIHEYQSDQIPERGYDEETGLFLWKKD